MTGGWVGGVWSRDFEFDRASLAGPIELERVELSELGRVSGPSELGRASGPSELG
jgi:hypothetical protein